MFFLESGVFIDHFRVLNPFLVFGLVHSELLDFLFQADYLGPQLLVLLLENFLVELFAF